MQPFHHPPVERDDALAAVFRLLEGGENLACRGLLLGARSEGLVGGGDLARMDQRLAVHAEYAALPAFGPKTVLVLDVIVDAVDDVEAMGACRRNAGREPGEHGRPLRRQQRARCLGKIVGAHDETGEQAAARDRAARDGKRIQHGERRLHHRPEARAVRRARAG